MMQNEYTAGQLLSINNLIVEVCQVVAGQCSNCVGFKKKTLCNKLPDCGNKFYFRKLNKFEIRRAEKNNRIIKDINSKYNRYEEDKESKA